MAWVRLGDDAASNGTVLAVLEDDEADDRSPEEVFGFVMLLASVSAAQWQSYAVTFGQAIQQARSRERAERLLRLAQRAGYGELQQDTSTGRLRFVLNDDPNFVHMITKEEKDWATQQKADNSNPVLVVQVRHRDGDACRYCGVVVNFADRKGGRGGTYDHRPPGIAVASPEHLVVACRTCNGTRGEISQGLDPEAGLAAADRALPLREVPKAPYYKPTTVDWLSENRSILIQFGLTIPSRPRKDLRAGTLAPGVDPAPATGVRPTAASSPSAQPAQQVSADPAPVATVCDPQQDRWQPVQAAGSTGSTPTPGGAPGAPQKATRERAGQTGKTPTKQIPADSADRRSAGSGYAGSGRDGKGRVGTGQAGPGRARDAGPPPAGPAGGRTPPRRRRGRRGGGSRG